MGGWIASPMIRGSLLDRSAARFATDASHRQSRCPIPASGTARQNRPRLATSRSIDGSRPWTVPMDRTTAASYDHGHGMNEQREAVADRPIESEQQRKRHNQLADAQSVRSLHRQRHPVKVTGDARGSARKNELLDAPLQQKRAEKESQNEERGWNAVVEFG